jgi:hypothetical protein
MKTVIWGLLLAAAASAGCFPQAPFLGGYSNSTPPTPESAAGPTPAQTSAAPVRPEQVNERNAHEMGAALRAEEEADAEAAPHHPDK